MRLLDESDAAFLDVRPEVEHGFLQCIQSRLSDTVWQSGCKSWYLDEHGRNFVIWPHFTWKYWLETSRLGPSDYRLTGRSETGAITSKRQLAART